jgi:hypothetical protein
MLGMLVAELRIPVLIGKWLVGVKSSTVTGPTAPRKVARNPVKASAVYEIANCQILNYGCDRLQY